MQKKQETIYLLIGADRDPMPEEPKRTLYWIAAGPCASCGHAERHLLRRDAELVLECARCAGVVPIGLGAERLRECSYVFWCSQPRFESDDVPLSRQERDEIERLLAQLGEDEPTFYGVVIEAGICRRTRDCITADCPYNHRSPPR
jgi:hypothetical protein